MATTKKTPESIVRDVQQDGSAASVAETGGAPEAGPGRIVCAAAGRAAGTLTCDSLSGIDAR